jgi:hypothetical protein
MRGFGDPVDPYEARFDRIVAGLRAEGGKRAAEPERAPASSPGQGRMDDVSFALVWLAVIVALSVLVGGWIGLAVVLTAVIVSVRLMFR